MISYAPQENERKPTSATSFGAGKVTKYGDTEPRDKLRGEHRIGSILELQVKVNVCKSGLLAKHIAQRFMS